MHEEGAVTLFFPLFLNYKEEKRHVLCGQRRAKDADIYEEFSSLKTQ